MWHLNFLSSLRGVGWSWKVKGVPSDQKDDTQSRRSIVRAQLTKPFVFYSLFDLMALIIRGRTPPQPLWSLSLLQQLNWTWIPGLASYWTLNMQFALFAAIAVGSGLSSPEKWPPLMGNIWEVSTVRSFWGAFWHQGLREVSLLWILPYTPCSSEKFWAD